MTTQITQQDAMTEGQCKQIKRLLEDGINAIKSFGFSNERLQQIKHLFEEYGINAIKSFGFSKNQAQQIIESGGFLQSCIKDDLIHQLGKHGVSDGDLQDYMKHKIVYRIKHHSGINYRSFLPPYSEFDLTVPADYDHDRWLDQVYRTKTERHLKIEDKNLHEDDCLHDKDLYPPDPFRIMQPDQVYIPAPKLHPGEVYRVRIFPFEFNASASAQDGINFLESQRGAILVGAHGLLLAQNLHGDKFPVEERVISFPQSEISPFSTVSTLWVDKSGYCDYSDIQCDCFDNLFGAYLLCFFEK